MEVLTQQCVTAKGHATRFRNILLLKRKLVEIDVWKLVSEIGELVNGIKLGRKCL